MIALGAEEGGCRPACLAGEGGGSSGVVTCGCFVDDGGIVVCAWQGGACTTMGSS